MMLMKAIFSFKVVYDFSKLMGIYIGTILLENNLTVGIKT